MSHRLRAHYRVVSLAVLIVLLAAGLGALEVRTAAASPEALPNAPNAILEQAQSSQAGDAPEQQQPGPDPKLGESSTPQQKSPQTPLAEEQPKRILYIIPNYRAVSADANVAPLDAEGKFKLFLDDSFDYSTFIYVGFLVGIGMGERSVPQFGAAAAFGRYYWRIFADQALGNSFTEFMLPVAFKQDPR